MLEDLIKPVFSGTLQGIPDKRRGPAEKDAAESFFGIDLTPGREIRAVDAGVDLASTFDQVEWRDGRMCRAYVLSESPCGTVSYLHGNSPQATS
jgi:hypothetical protein